MIEYRAIPAVCVEPELFSFSQGMDFAFFEHNENETSFAILPPSIAKVTILMSMFFTEQATVFMPTLPNSYGLPDVGSAGM